MNLANEFNPVSKPSYKRRKPKRRNRNEFSPKVKKQIKKQFNHTCQECLIVFDDSQLTVHHVWPRSKSGRGVFTNGLPGCWPCHDSLERNDKRKRYWQDIFEQRYGPDYFRDEWD